MDNYKYWYFRFTKEFILNNTIQNIKDAYPDGWKIGFIYMELCAIAIEGCGYFAIENVGPINFYDIIARRINETKEDVVRATEILIKAGILTVEFIDLEGEISSTLKIPALENNIGTSSSRADKQRIRDRERALRLDNEKKLIEDDKNQEQKLRLGFFKNVLLSEEQYLEIKAQYSNYEEIINAVSFLFETKQMDYKDGAYEYCLQFAKELGEKNEVGIMSSKE